MAEVTNEEEEAIEAAYWAFDVERNRTGVERDAFKGQMRQLLRALKTRMLTWEYKVDAEANTLTVRDGSGAIQAQMTMKTP